MARRYRTKRVLEILNADLLTNEGRLSALSNIAKLCVDGYVREVVNQKTGEIEPALIQDPATAISAIREISRLDNGSDDGLTVQININEVS